MDFAIPNKDTILKTPLDSPPATATPPLDVQQTGFTFWDWHSYFIVGLLFLIGYHVWTFRALYSRYFDELRHAITSRDFDVDIRVEMVVRKPNKTDTISVSLTPDSRVDDDVVLEANDVTDGTTDRFYDCV